MGIPQGSTPWNSTVITSLTAQIQGCENCAQLQTLVNDVIANLNGLIGGLVIQNNLLGPMQALLTAPANPTAAVTWIQNFITDYLTPTLACYASYAAKVAALATQITALVNAINTAAAAIDGCSITIPAITPLPPF
jgi:hypothetical protein